MESSLIWRVWLTLQALNHFNRCYVRAMANRLHEGAGQLRSEATGLLKHLNVTEKKTYR